MGTIRWDWGLWNAATSVLIRMDSRANPDMYLAVAVSMNSNAASVGVLPNTGVRLAIGADAML